ncbi:MAG: hypothetical protein HY291_11805 [Planctomycetes bacterium]|nr:hypothetical protein [Planctomycetota bacterium]
MPGELENLQNGTFTLDCPTITLKQMSLKAKLSFSGSGFISYNNLRRLSFKMFTKKASPHLDPFEPRKTKAGELITKEEYFKLTAIDATGKKWTASFVLPRCTSPINNKRIVLEGTLDRISTDAYWPGVKLSPSYKLYLLENVELPCNTAVHTEETIDGKRGSSSTRYCIAKFEACGHNITVKCDKSASFLAAEAIANHSVLFFLKRLHEVLIFVLGQKLSSHIQISTAGIKSKLEIISDPYFIKDPRHGQPPLANRFELKNDFYKLFDLYLGFICKNRKDSWHKFTEYIHIIHESRHSSLQAQALALSVAVEGIAKCLVNKTSPVNSKAREELMNAQDIINQTNLDSKLKKRICGAIGSWNNPNVNQLLSQFFERGLIDSSLLEDWKKLRNISVHADSSNSREFQKIISLCDSALTLCYQMVFCAIGYTGPFKDYSTPGWPSKPYPPIKPSISVPIKSDLM